MLPRILFGEGGGALARSLILQNLDKKEAVGCDPMTKEYGSWIGGGGGGVYLCELSKIDRYIFLGGEREKRIILI